MSVARAGAVGAGKVLRDGTQRERAAYAAVSRLERTWQLRHTHEEEEDEEWRHRHDVKLRDQTRYLLDDAVAS